MREGQLGSKLSDLLRKQGAIVAPFVASEKSLPGFPDKLISFPDCNFLAEFKVPGNKLSAKQANLIAGLITNGINVAAIWFCDIEKFTLNSELHVQSWKRTSISADCIVTSFRTPARLLLYHLREWFTKPIGDLLSSEYTRLGTLGDSP